MPNHALKVFYMLKVVGTRVKNLKIFNFLKINFYTTLRYVEQDFEI